MSAATQLELLIVEQYNAEQEQRRAEMLHWIAEALEEAFTS